MWFVLLYLYLTTVVLCLEQPGAEIVERLRERFYTRRAVDGSRGRKYFDPNLDDGSFDSYDSSGGNYDSSQVKSGFMDIRSNVPGEPGVDYPVYTNVPKTRFSCEGRIQGYYADENAGCQAFHVCHNVVVASFVCPVGSIFSQELLTCDWWNKVNCVMTKSYSSMHQDTYKTDGEMIQKALAMMQPPERNNMVRQMKTIDVKVKENVRESKKQNYNNLPRVLSHSESEKDVINIHLRPRNFEVNSRGLNSKLNNMAKDSSLFYIQRNVNDNLQNSYSTARLSTSGYNFQNPYRQNVRVFGNEFQPSYAPTVPTVTTTTRRLYSPTVPTTYRLSTISYDNNDQNLEESHYSLTRNADVNSLKKPSTVASINTTTESSSVFGHSANLRRETDSTLHEEQRVDQRLEKNDNFSTNNYSEVYEQTGAMKSTSGENDGTSNPRTKILPLIVQIPRPTSPSGSATSDLSKQIFTYNSFDATPQLIPYSSQPEASPELRTTSVTDGERVFETPLQSSFIDSTEKNSTVDTSQGQSFESSHEIPPLIPQNSQSTSRWPSVSSVEKISRTPPTISPLIPQSAISGSSTKTQPTNLPGDQKIFRTPPSESPLIPETFQSAPPSGIQILNEFDGANKFSVPALSLVPPLIPQNSQSTGASGKDSADSVDKTQIFESPKRIPPLIPQVLQTGSSVETKSSSSPADGNNSNTLSKIPVLIPKSSQSGSSSGVQTPGGIKDANMFASPTLSLVRPIIPEIPSAPSTKTQTPSTSNEKNISRTRPKIAPLIPQISQPAGTQPSDVPNDKNISNSPPKISPLIPQTSQPVSLPETQSSNISGDENVFKTPSKISPLIPSVPQSVDLPRMNSTDVNRRVQTSGDTDNMNKKNSFNGSLHEAPSMSQDSRPPEILKTYHINTFHQKETSFSSIKGPFLIGPPQPPNLSTASFDYTSKQFNPFSSTTQIPQFTFQGQYQKPLLFGLNQPDYRYGIRPTTGKPFFNININVENGSGKNCETKMDSPEQHNSGVTGFRIHVSDLPPTNHAYYENDFISPSGTLASSSRITDSITKESSAKSSQTINIPFQVSKSSPDLLTTGHKESNIATILLPPKIDKSFPIPSTNNVKILSRTETKPSTRMPFSTNERDNNYNSSQQTSGTASMMLDTGTSILQDSAPIAKRPEYNNNLQFTIRGALSPPVATASPYLNVTSSTCNPECVGTTLDTPDRRIFGSQSSNSSDNSINLSGLKSITADVMTKTNAKENNSSQPTSPPQKLEDSKERFESITLKNSLETTSFKSVKNLGVLESGTQQIVQSNNSPPNLPVDLSQFESAIGDDNDSPIEISITVNGDEEFNPSGDFINKLLAHHLSNISLGLDGYEIIRSENPDGSDSEENVKSTVAPNTKPQIEQSPLFDVINSSGNEKAKQKNEFLNQNSNPGNVDSKADEIPVKFDAVPRPFSMGRNQNAAFQAGLKLKLNAPADANPSVLNSNVKYEQMEKMRAKAEDINSSIESLMESSKKIFENSSLRKDQILKQLTQNFGEPLYTLNPPSYFVPPELVRKVDFITGQQFMDSQFYRVGKNMAANRQESVTNPDPPKTTVTTTTTTTTTPKPVKTFVETEFLPSVSFSFDTDVGRQEYVEAILKGLLTENQPVDPWSNVADNFYWESK